MSFWIPEIALSLIIGCVMMLQTSLAAGPIECFNCTRLADPNACKNFNLCGAGQRCYKEVVELETGEAAYTWGCASTQLCLLEENLSEQRKRLTSQRCYECCDTNFCNFGGCTKDFCAKVTCAHNGTCTNTPLGHACTCQTGYTGNFCDIDIDECAPSPCLNNATCTDFIGSYSCTCPKGFTGKNCEINIDECALSLCKSGSTCVDGIADFTCVCQAGITGRLCEIDVDECASSPCQNGATCTDQINGYTCDCINGYVGSNCEIDVDECANVTCLNGAVCADEVGYFECTCKLGFTGKFCETSLGRVCYNCDDVDDVQKCNNRTICASGEQCYLKHELVQPNVFSYSMGCVSILMCDYVANNGLSGRRAATNSIQLCYECCDINECNHHACVDDFGNTK